MTRVPIEEFGRHLLDTDDLDPVYVALWLMRVRKLIDEAQLNRWLVAYWVFYHCGVASYMSELGGNGYWTQMLEANKHSRMTPVKGLERWPRGKERRHMRGLQGETCILGLARSYPNPSDMIEGIVKESYDLNQTEPYPFASIRQAVQMHRGFGPWIAFKVADMLERICGYSICFQESEIFMFNTPWKAAMMQHDLMFPDSNEEQFALAENCIRAVCDKLQETFGHYDAPPRSDRKVNLQEIETILCKWKSHMSGHYPLYNDIDEISEGTEPWAECCETAEKFMLCMPKRK